jgi:hypothetical protein
MTRDEEIVWGQRAKQLIDDPTLQRILEEIEEQYVDAWKHTQADDAEGRERLFQAVKVLGHFRVHLRAMADAGQLSAANIERLKRRVGG